MTKDRHSVSPGTGHMVAEFLPFWFLVQANFWEWGTAWSSGGGGHISFLYFQINSQSK
jgi:hypothetical protein